MASRNASMSGDCKETALPAERAVNLPVCVVQNRRKEGVCERPGADFFDEARTFAQLHRLPLMRIDDADCLAQLRAHRPDRRDEIGVVRNDDSNLVRIREAIDEKLSCEVHVRALLLHVDDFDAAGAVRFWPFYGMRLERPEEDLNLRDRAERPQKRLLARYFSRVVRRRFYDRGEVLHS